MRAASHKIAFWVPHSIVSSHTTCRRQTIWFLSVGRNYWRPRLQMKRQSLPKVYEATDILQGYLKRFENWACKGTLRNVLLPRTFSPWQALRAGAWPYIPWGNCRLTIEKHVTEIINSIKRKIRRWSWLLYHYNKLSLRNKVLINKVILATGFRCGLQVYGIKKRSQIRQ